MKDSLVIPVSLIIATKDRMPVLKRTLMSVMSQSHLPTEVIIIDASATDHEKDFSFMSLDQPSIRFFYHTANEAGATHQRLQGIAASTQSVIWFLDDDVILEEDCTKRLFEGLTYQQNVGAVNAMITNQRYTRPGIVTRTMYRLMYGKYLSSYAGKVIGPAWNLLPQDDERMGYCVVCEWLNTTCTMYRKEALPSPVFPEFFYGYSMFEDVTLSVTIAKTHSLLNARTARIFHDSQTGAHKNNVMRMARMALVNRYYVMTRVLERRGWKFNVKLLMLETFIMVTSLRSLGALLKFPLVVTGKLLGIVEISRARW